MAVTSLIASSGILKTLLKLGAVALVANEIRGFMWAVPVMYALWQSGGTLMAYWLAFCTLGGIALSVIVPLWVARKIKSAGTRQSAA